MRRRWVTNFRWPALGRQAAVGIVPRRRRRTFLLPVHERGLAAPVEQLGHGAPVSARHHEGAHRGFVGPDGARPLPAMVVTHDVGDHVAGAAFRLTHRPQRVDQEGNEITGRTQPQARNGNEHGESSVMNRVSCATNRETICEFPGSRVLKESHRARCVLACSRCLFLGGARHQ